MLHLNEVTGKLSRSHNLIVGRKINWAEGGGGRSRRAVEQVFGGITENLMSAVFLSSLDTFPVRFQSYCSHSSEGFVLAKKSFILFFVGFFNAVS